MGSIWGIIYNQNIKAMPAENVTKFNDETLAEFVSIHAREIGLDVHASSTDFEPGQLPRAVRAIKWTVRMEILAEQLTQLECFGKSARQLKLPPRKFEAGDNPAACVKCPLSEACLIKERKEVPITSAKAASRPSMKTNIPAAASTATNDTLGKRVAHKGMKTNKAAAIAEGKAIRSAIPEGWSEEDWKTTQDFNDTHQIDDGHDDKPIPNKPGVDKIRQMDDFIIEQWEREERERINRGETNDLPEKPDPTRSSTTNNLTHEDFDNEPDRTHIQEEDNTIGPPLTRADLIKEGYPPELVDTPTDEWTDGMWGIFDDLYNTRQIKPTRKSPKAPKPEAKSSRPISLDELKDLVARDDPGFTPHLEVNGIKKPIKHYEGKILLDFIVANGTLSPRFISKIIKNEECEILRKAISTGNPDPIHALLKNLHLVANEIYTFVITNNTTRLKQDYSLTLDQASVLVESFQNCYEKLASQRPHVSGEMVAVQTPKAFRDPIDPSNMDSHGNLIMVDTGHSEEHEIQLVAETSDYDPKTVHRRSYISVATIAGINVPPPESLIMVEHEGTQTYTDMNCFRQRRARNLGFISSPFNGLTKPGGFISELYDAYGDNEEKRRAARASIMKMFLNTTDAYAYNTGTLSKYIPSCLKCETSNCALLNIYQGFRTKIVRVGQYWDFVDTLGEFLNSDLIQNLTQEIDPEQIRDDKLADKLTDDKGKNPLESLEFDTIEITPETPSIAIPFILFNKYYGKKWGLVGRFHLYHDNFTSASTKIFIPLDQRSRVFESYTLGHGSDQVLAETGIDIKQQGRIRQRFFQSLTYTLSVAELEEFNAMLSAYDVEPRFEEYSYEDYDRTTHIISSIDTILEINLRPLKGKIPLDNEVLLSNLQDFLSEIDIEYLSLEEALDNIGIHFNSESVNQSLRADFVNFLLGKDKGPKRLSFIYKFLFGMGIRRCNAEEGLVKGKGSLASLAEFVFDESKSATVIEGLMHPEFKSYPRLNTVTAILNTRRLFNSALEKIGYSTSRLSYSERKRLILQNIDRITNEILKFATIPTTRYPETPFGIADTSLDLRYLSDLGINEREVNDVITAAQNILAHIGLERSKKLDGQELFSRYTLQWDKLSADFGNQMLKVINPPIEP
ncbi:hypothetical protein KBD45_00905 [Candidatus Dojkabacteria bacterium]|nr:hypothetical protein [Candidatus Dojkabacteria bacterium]